MKSRRITVKVTANASRNEIISWEGDRLKIKIKAPAERGRANEALLRFLAQYLGIHHREIRLVRGATSTIKVLAINSSSEETLEQKLQFPSDPPDAH